MPWRLDNTDLVKLIEKLLRLTHPEAERSRAFACGWCCPNNLSPANLDPGRIEQLLLNLLLNAFAAMPKGGSVTIEIRDLSDSVAIDVADTGSGIPADLQGLARSLLHHGRHGD
ncbi:MAG: ATP-binding protein [Planctomycetaceae bacterium]